MKVLAVINSLVTGGAEKLILDTVPLMNEKCHCDVYLLNRKSFPFELELEKTHSHRIIKSSVNGLYHIGHIFKLMILIRKYDVVHVHLFPAQYFVLFAKVLSFSKTKIILTEHNTTNNRLDNKFIKPFDKLTYRFFDVAICISHEIKDIMMTYTGLPEHKFPVVENGIHLEKIIQAKSVERKDIAGLMADDIVLLQVSGFRTQKDQQTVVKSLKFLPNHVKVCFAGIGVTLNECQKLVQDLELQERVIFLGVRTDVPALLKMADLIVLSSHFEGLSLSSVEGMASGKPFIASNVPGLREVVVGAGLLFEDKNDKALAQHIIGLMNDVEYYQNVANACQERAKQFDILAMVNEIV